MSNPRPDVSNTPIQDDAGPGPSINRHLGSNWNLEVLLERLLASGDASSSGQNDQRALNSAAPSAVGGPVHAGFGSQQTAVAGGADRDLELAEVAPAQPSDTSSRGLLSTLSRRTQAAASAVAAYGGTADDAQSSTASEAERHRLTTASGLTIQAVSDWVGELVPVLMLLAWVFVVDHIGGGACHTAGAHLIKLHAGRCIGALHGRCM